MFCMLGPDEALKILIAWRLLQIGSIVICQAQPSKAVMLVLDLPIPPRPIYLNECLHWIKVLSGHFSNIEICFCLKMCISMD